MKKPAVILAFTLALTLTACGTSIEKDAEYEDVNQLGAAFESATGVACTKTENGIDAYGWVYTNCGPTAQVMLFVSDEKREEILSKNPLGAGERWVQGKNWVVKTTQYEAEKVQKKLGGKLIKS